MQKADLQQPSKGVQICCKVASLQHLSQLIKESERGSRRELAGTVAPKYTQQLAIPVTPAPVCDPHPAQVSLFSLMFFSSLECFIYILEDGIANRHAQPINIKSIDS